MFSARANKVAEGLMGGNFLLIKSINISDRKPSTSGNRGILAPTHAIWKLSPPIATPGQAKCAS